MMKVRKKLFTLSGLFMVLAQVFVAAFCGITAIAVTQEETTQSLYSNEYGSAAMSYELLENDRIKWTLTLAKTGQQTATQFMVDLAVDGTSLVPENVTSEGISLIGASSNGHIQAGLSETATTMGGSGTVTFETARAIGTLTATPRLITSVEVPVETPVTAMAAEITTETPSEEAEAVQPAEETPVQTETVVTNLLDGVGQTTFAIPDVEVVEEIDPVEPTDPNTPENDGGEVTGIDVVEDEQPGEVNEDEEDIDVEEEKEQSKIQSATTMMAPLAEKNPLPPTTDITSLRFEKTWVIPKGSKVEDLPPITIQIMQGDTQYGADISISLAEELDFDKALSEEEIAQGKNRVIEQGTLENGAYYYYVTVREWKNLPIERKDGKVLEYTIQEVDSDYYEEGTPIIKESSIDSMFMESSNNSTDWQVIPTFVIARTTGGKEYFVWTLNHINEEDRKAFIASVLNYGSVVEQPIRKELSSYVNGTSSTPFTWCEGPNLHTTVQSGDIDVTVGFNSDGTIKDAQLTFGGKNVWTHFVTGGYSTKKVAITNTYIPHTKITVQKVWDDGDYGKTTRNDIELWVQQKIGTGDWNLNPVTKFEILKNSTIFSSDFTLPSKILGQDVYYRVIEKVKNTDGNYEDSRVYGYDDPVATVTGDKHTVTNTLLKTSFNFIKVGNDGEEPLDGVRFSLVGDNGYSKGVLENDQVRSEKDGSVIFSELPVGNYTLNELETVDGYQLSEGWKFSVVEEVDSSGDFTGNLVIDGLSDYLNGDGNFVLVNKLKPFDLIVNKKDDLGKDLVGAEFTLTKLEDSTFKKVLSKDDNQDPISQFVFKDLTPGTYTLEETKAPDGYAKLTETITIIISELGVVDVKYSDSETGIPANVTFGANNSANTITFSVANKKKVPLPATGGSGTMMFVTIGVLALTATGLYFLKRKDQEVA